MTNALIPGWSRAVESGSRLAEIYDNSIESVHDALFFFGRIPHIVRSHFSKSYGASTVLNTAKAPKIRAMQEEFVRPDICPDVTYMVPSLEIGVDYSINGLLERVHCIRSTFNCVKIVVWDVLYGHGFGGGLWR